MEQVSHALAAMYSSGSKQDREVAAKFLESFQKSESAWSLIHEMLQSPSTSIEQRLFAAQTLRAKINYDLFQLPESSQTSLQRGLLQLLASVKEEHKAIVTQLCLCVAGLAAQMDWPNALQDVMGTLGDDEGSWRILLTFVSVLPDEVGDVRRTSLSEDELNEHMHKLLSQNGSNVLHLILRYLQSHGSNGKFTNLVFECCTSWLREWNLTEVLASPLTNFTFAALTDEAMFDAATELLCSMFNETRDVDECITSIETLYPYVAGLRPEIKKSVDNEDRFQGLTRIFCEAGEAWHVLMARMPTSMLTLVEAIADCCALDKDREVVKYSFQFWYLLKQMVTLEKFQDAKQSFQDVYTRLADTMIDLLQYPAGEDDLFDGDRESEEKFRSFRHEMGDVMKDCCAVIGSSKCLSMAFDRLHNSMAKGTWQEVEAPLFAMRAMAREVNMDEGNVLPTIMNFLVQLPEHPKVRYAATLVLGRYTEWTAQHPEYLEFQLNYITHGFESNDIELASAAAQALKHFCQDCASLLEGHLSQLHPFYTRVGQQLDLESWYEVTDGIAHVIAKQPLNQVAEYLRLFCQPIIERLLVYSATDTAEVHRKIADEVELLTIFVRVVTPYVPISEPHPCVTFWQSAWPVLSTLLQRFARVVFVSERICRFLRSMIQSYRQHTQPMLGLLAETLVSQFDSTSQGCYLWVSGAIVQVYGDAENVGNETRLAVWPFCERQSVGMFRLLNTSEPHEIPDVIEDFFRLSSDILQYYPLELTSSSIMASTMAAALSCLSLELEDPLLAVLHFLRDLLIFGRSMLGRPSLYPTIPTSVQETVLALCKQQGAQLVARMISGLIYSFPRDCVPDASGLYMSLVELCPSEAPEWIFGTLNMLPQGTISDLEREKFNNQFRQNLSTIDDLKIRSQIQDFTSWYRRRNITPRTDKTRLESLNGAHFRYE